MNKNRLTVSGIKTIAKELKDKLSSNHISNVTIINSFDLIMSFSNYRQEKLLISLNPQNPFLSLIEIKDSCPTKIGSLNDTLRKEVKDGYILDVEVINEDRIISIEYGYTNEYFDKEIRFLVIEFIPHRPNLFLLDENKKIRFAFHYSDMSSTRPVLKGLIYQEPINENKIIEDFDYESYKKESLSYYYQAKHRRLEEQFKPVLQHIKSRIKTLKQKIAVLNKEMDEANQGLQCQEIGSSILALSYDEESLKDYIEENNIGYDWNIKPSINAEKYFKRYKKYKRTLEMDQLELDKTSDEINYLTDCLNQTRFMNEEDVVELGNLLFPHKFKLPARRKVEYKPDSIKVDGATIYFGKNAKQNDNLTFKKANRDYTFVHIKDYHGSHVVIDQNKPSNEVLLTACEIALLLSGKDCGDVQVTLIKNVKKGTTPGQAILGSYQTYTINKIREKTADLLKK